MSSEIEKNILAAIKENVPAILQEQCLVYWQSFIENIEDSYFSASWDAQIIDTLPRVWACSEVAARWCIRNPNWLQSLSKQSIADSNYSQYDYQQSWGTHSEQLTDEASLFQQLRYFRNQQMLRIIWRDISGFSDLQNTVKELTALAEVCINAALDFYTNADSDFVKQFGIACNEVGEQQELIVIAMGKLGAWELNLSSDIDLIFAYRDDGMSQGGAQQINNSDYFIRLGKKLIAALNNTTEDGFVFRVDMRLRPFGDGGALASSFNALENYYQIHGREWERYAMIKARVVCGSEKNTNELMQMLRPFVYRRYMDYGAYESMRELKTMISQQVKKKGMQANVKLGAGGIREVEFIAQVFQLIRGGRDEAYQQRQLVIILVLLKQQQRLPEYVVDELLEAYTFLRNTEHKIQAYRDQQTHQLPGIDEDRQRLAYAMNFKSWDKFITQLEQHRVKVNSHFEQVFDAPQTESESGDETVKDVWLQRLSDEQAETVLEQLGYSEPAKALAVLNMLRNSQAFQVRTTHGQKRLNQLMPMVIAAVGQVEQSELSLQRIIEIIEHIAKRSVYMSLLIENPLALSQLVKLSAQSAWVTRYISMHPLLLDDLLDPRSLYVPPEKKTLQQEYQDKISSYDINDDELLADITRHFKQTNVLRVAAADLANVITLMRISDHLTWIAEVILDVTLEQAWRSMIKRYGRPVCGAAGEVCDKGFAIIGYGKLGGYELGYASDLDMVFLHGAENDQAMTHIAETADEQTSARSVANSVFFARLGQRLIHLLSSRTAAGTLYEVDMRLRPDGASGMLVSSVKAYEKYQHNKAWVWEHQALVRARAICGDPLIMQQFNKIRQSVLTKQRDITELKKEVLSMREKMRHALSKDNPQQFDIKQGIGGLVDIEFIVQFGVLAWSNQHPALCEYTDNVRLLEGLKKIGKLSADDAECLTTVYKKYRQRLHRLALQEQKGFVPVDKYSRQREAVRLIWAKIFSE